MRMEYFWNGNWWGNRNIPRRVSCVSPAWTSLLIKCARRWNRKTKRALFRNI